MQLNHDRIRQILHIITIIAFGISVIFQLRNLYLYGGKPPKLLDVDDNQDDNQDDIPDDVYVEEIEYSDTEDSKYTESNR